MAATRAGPPSPSKDRDAPLFWLPAGVCLEDLLDCRDWPPQLEMTVTGHTRRRKDPRRPQLGKGVTVNGIELALFRWGSSVFASAARCPHMKGKLEVGDIEDISTQGMPPRRVQRTHSLGLDSDFDEDVAAAPQRPRGPALCVTCPVHGFQFDAATGISVMPPGSFHLQMFPTRLVKEEDADSRAARAAAVKEPGGLGGEPPASGSAAAAAAAGGEAVSERRRAIEIGFEALNLSSLDDEDF
ncbi:hypothetical protein FNF28_04110 [Cafeteria roenbergensis]|uniref:Rieske domain-containing protein n=1 Tax=Cafeteria roenbergensis TaxID=33653 RepID=A0A5A8DFD9_CAFRO|nr:hypothetical protein FNF28_04110 [Cafeteria roenbergensis]